ncbi:MAG: hypothetical protein M1818_001649 [Claussenomyces sp. TS43310]|nr:MAG: hypothetical protein M1818_001649 [Claussenomyces sp. TS43310]
MVKHQRRSHQNGIHCLELDDGETSDSDSGDSPSTPSQSGVQWPQSIPSRINPGYHQGHPLQRARSYNDFGQQHHFGGQATEHADEHRHSISSEPRRSSYLVPTTNEQYSSQHLAHGGAFYVPGPPHPGMVSLSTHPVANISRYQMPTQLAERHRGPYGQHGLGNSAQSSPGGYSTASTRSPAPSEIFYAQQPMQQQPSYHMQNAAPVERPQPIVHYQHQAPPPMNQTQVQAMVPVALAPPPPPQEQYQQPPQQQWYANAPFQEPVGVIATMPYCNGGSYDAWQVKLEPYDDPALQMPSARIENL